MKTAELIAKIAKEPAKLQMVADILENPRRGLEALNLMISREKDLKAIRRLQGLRDAVECYLAEQGGAA